MGVANDPVYQLRIELLGLLWLITGQLLLWKFAALSDYGVQEVLYDWVFAVFVGLFAVEVASAFGWVGRRQRLRFGAVLPPHFEVKAVFVALALLFTHIFMESVQSVQINRHYQYRPSYKDFTTQT